MKIMLVLVVMELCAQTRAMPAEIPGGVINGINTFFTISHTPNPLSSLHVYENGLRLRSPNDYSFAVVEGGAVARIAFVPAATPQTGDSLVVDYTY
jgi:hypothetical protein